MTSPSRSEQRRLVGILEADPQELLPRPLPQPLRQPGEALRGTQRRQRGLHEAAQPVDDAVAVALQLLQLVGEDAEPGREGLRPGGGVLGQRRGGQFTDLLPGGGADLLVAGGVGVPYENVARLPYACSAADSSATQPRSERRVSAAAGGRPRACPE